MARESGDFRIESKLVQTPLLALILELNDGGYDYWLFRSLHLAFYFYESLSELSAINLRKGLELRLAGLKVWLSLRAALLLDSHLSYSMR